MAVTVNAKNSPPVNTSAGILIEVCAVSRTAARARRVWLPFGNRRSTRTEYVFADATAFHVSSTGAVPSNETSPPTVASLPATWKLPGGWSVGFRFGVPAVYGNARVFWMNIVVGVV